LKRKNKYIEEEREKCILEIKNYKKNTLKKLKKERKKKIDKNKLQQKKK
jgi:hypothetical protein